MRNEFIGFFIISALAILLWAYFVNIYSLWFFVLFVPLYTLGFYDMIQNSNSIYKNFPIVGRGRSVMEDLRPKIHQYFVETNINGTPVSRNMREMVYNRSIKGNDTIPFGTQHDVYSEGYEWMNHSIASNHLDEIKANPRIRIGAKGTNQKYEASILNISAMSYGSLSANAIEALNKGAKLGDFYHNTGEGGISPYHLNPGGDLVFQIGTGYFGVRDEHGNFDRGLFKEKSWMPSVKMIEVKLSQGAKPGHGGLLPAQKNTPEIAKIRNIKPGKAVHSPPFHTVFSTPAELMNFIVELRELSNGKPVGFKMCMGSRMEFISLCKAMVKTGNKPDFITIDGGEGGTGAAPAEFSDNVGMPYKEGLSFAYDALVGFDLKKDIKLIASGKIISGFDIFKSFALGADLCNSARGMMLALGCIQALECHENTCPTGVTTHNKELMAGLSVSDKQVKVANYHNATVNSFRELVAAAGIKSPEEINRHMVYRRMNMYGSQSYAQIFPYIEKGCLLDSSTVPEYLRTDWEFASGDKFQPILSQSQDM